MGKKTVAILLLTVFITINLNHVFFNFYRIKIRHEIKTLIEKHLTQDIQTVNIENSSKIKWITKEKEFTKNGVFYDVIKVKHINGKKIYICIVDDQETRLVSNFVKNHKPLAKAITSMAKLFVKYLPAFINLSQSYKSFQLDYTEPENTYSFQYIHQIIKPPKF